MMVMMMMGNACSSSFAGDIFLFFKLSQHRVRPSVVAPINGTLVWLCVFFAKIVPLGLKVILLLHRLEVGSASIISK